MYAVNPTLNLGPSISIAIAIDLNRHFFVERIDAIVDSNKLKGFAAGKCYMACHPPVSYYEDHAETTPPDVLLYTLAGQYIDTVDAAEFARYFQRHSFAKRCAV